MAERVSITVLEACPRCYYVACICRFSKRHPAGCQRRAAVLNKKPDECKPHGVYACKICWPCSCGGDAP